MPLRPLSKASEHSSSLTVDQKNLAGHRITGWREADGGNPMLRSTSGKNKALLQSHIFWSCPEITLQRFSLHPKPVIFIWGLEVASCACNTVTTLLLSSKEKVAGNTRLTFWKHAFYMQTRQNSVSLTNGVKYISKQRTTSTTKNSHIFYLENSKEFLTKCHKGSYYHLSKSTAMNNGLTPISLLTKLDSEYWAVLVTLPFSPIPKTPISIWPQTPCNTLLQSRVVSFLYLSNIFPLLLLKQEYGSSIMQEYTLYFSRLFMACLVIYLSKGEEWKEETRQKQWDRGCQQASCRHEFINPTHEGSRLKSWSHLYLAHLKSNPWVSPTKEIEGKEARTPFCFQAQGFFNSPKALQERTEFSTPQTKD